MKDGKGSWEPRSNSSAARPARGGDFRSAPLRDNWRRRVNDHHEGDGDGGHAEIRKKRK